MPQSDPLLSRLLRRLIARSFPRLRLLGITIAWGGGDDLLYYAVQGGNRLIRVNECLRPASTRALEGGIAHELCHVDADLRLRPYQRELAWARYGSSRWYRMREERAAEMRAIELGYGPNLLTFIRFARKIGYSFSREHGLLYAEILRAMRTPAYPSFQNSSASDRLT